MTDKPQMKQGDNRRMMGEVWHFWGDGSPADLEDNPGYFDKVMYDLVDVNMGDARSAVGAIFRVFLGSPTRAYHWAEFMVCGVQKTIGENQVAKYRLLWKRIGEWDYVNVDHMRGQRREVRWNVAKRQHEVMENGAVIFSTVDKDEALRVAGIPPPAAAA